MSFIWSVIMTIMDIVVFALCVDKGLTPVTIVGACYIALRWFSLDAQTAIGLSDEWYYRVYDKFKKWHEERRLKETEESSDVVEES